MNPILFKKLNFETTFCIASTICNGNIITIYLFVFYL